MRPGLFIAIHGGAADAYRKIRPAPLTGQAERRET